MTDFIDGFRRIPDRFFQGRTGRARGGDWVGLSARGIFILPTRAGLAYAGLLAVLLLGAINYNNNLLFGLTFLLAGLGLVAMLHCYHNLAGLRLRAGQGRAGFVGEPLGFQVWLDPADRRPRFGIDLEPDGGMAALTAVAADGTSVWLRRPAVRRGPLALGRVTVSSRFPLGLFRSWSNLRFDHAELAYPAPAPPGPPLPSVDGDRARLGDRSPGADDFRGLRSYHPGDSPRHVYWKALAREQGLLTKEFGAGQAQDCWVDFAQAREPDLEGRLRRLCRWILEAERAQLRYGLRLPGRAWPPGRGAAHRDRCLAALARVGLDP